MRPTTVPPEAVPSAHISHCVACETKHLLIQLPMWPHLSGASEGTPNGLEEGLTPFRFTPTIQKSRADVSANVKVDNLSAIL